MPKYLIQGRYTAEGVQGVMKDKAAGRKAAVSAAIKGVGGKLEAFYFSFGKEDVVLLVDLPDNTVAAGVALTTAASGLVRIRTTPLLTVEEVDKAIEVKANYRPPGSK